jgi:hypothetical protein
MATRFRPGQAFVELAMGMLALALVLAAALGFIEYILGSLEMQRTLRAKAGVGAMTATGGDGTFVTAQESGVVTVEPMAAEYIFGSEEVEIKESVHMPAMGGIFK